MSRAHLFIANPGSSVTELNISMRTVLRVIPGPVNVKFDRPDAMAVVGADLFVANLEGHSVAELPA